jgi:hypothetical protein
MTINEGGSVPTQTYYAKSVLLSKTIWINAAVAILALLEVREIIDVLPAGWLRYVPAVVAVLNILMRPLAVRPVAMIKPGETQAVVVESLPKTAA